MGRRTSKLNVTYLNPAAGLGGAERCLLDMILACRIEGGGINPSVILLEDGPLAAAVRALDVRCEVIPMPREFATLGESATPSKLALLAAGARMAACGPAIARYLAEIRRRVAGFHPAIVHSNGLKTHLITRWVRPARCPTICHLHDFIGARMISSLALKSLAKPDSYFIANSRSVAIDAASVLGSAAPIRTVYNGVDTTLFAPARVDGGRLDTLGSTSGIACDTVRVGLVATYARWKGQEVFISAIANLPPAVRRMARFYIIGGPIYTTRGSQWSQEELARLAQRSGVSSDLVFVPFQAQAESAMNSLDCVVHASTKPEPFGRTIIEAMASGKAVIVSAAGGAAELFTPGQEALGVPPGDVLGLAHAMERLITDASLRASLGQASRSLVERKFSLRRFGAGIIECYNLIATEHQTALSTDQFNS